MGRPSNRSAYSAIAFSLMAMLLFPAISEANCGAILKRGVFKIQRLTYYAPRYGEHNGKCGKSASQRNACDYFLEHHMAGKTRATFAAVSREGGSENFYGGIFSAPSVARYVGKECIIVAVGDRYGKASNGLSKMDIVVETLDIKVDGKWALSTLGSKFHDKSGIFFPVGRLEDLDKPERKIERVPEAMSAIPASESDEIGKLIQAIEVGAAAASLIPPEGT